MGPRAPGQAVAWGLPPEHPTPAWCYHPGLCPTTGPDQLQGAGSCVRQTPGKPCCRAGSGSALAVFSALAGTLTTSPELQALPEPHPSCGGGPPKFGSLGSFLPVSPCSSCLL